MRNLRNTTFRILSPIIALLFLVSSVQAQTGKWQAVRHLESGIPVSVKVKRSYYCIFNYATEDELVCGINRPLFQFTPRSFLRVQIREVRVWPDPRKSKGGTIGAGIGAGALATTIAVHCSKNRAECAPPALYLPLAALIGAGGGWLIGSLVSAVHATFQHGKVIYKR